MPHSKPENIAQILTKFFIKRKSLIIEGFLVVYLFYIMGHFTFNTWHRVVIKSQLTDLKTDLCALTETIDTIHDQYDHLHDKVHDLANKTYTALEKEEMTCKVIDEKNKNPKNITTPWSKNYEKETRECKKKKYAKDVPESHNKRKIGGEGDMKY